MWDLCFASAVAAAEQDAFLPFFAEPLHRELPPMGLEGNKNPRVDIAAAWVGSLLCCASCACLHLCPAPPAFPITLQIGHCKLSSCWTLFAVANPYSAAQAMGYGAGPGYTSGMAQAVPGGVMAAAGAGPASHGCGVPSDPVFPSTPTSWVTQHEVCRDHVNKNNCTKGSYCQYLHSSMLCPDVSGACTGCRQLFNHNAGTCEPACPFHPIWQRPGGGNHGNGLGSSHQCC
eukprot:gene2774-3398_t